MKNKLNRRSFLKNSSKLGIYSAFSSGIFSFFPPVEYQKNKLMTVNGWLAAHDAGFTLSHEHILVDFTGADQYDPSRWSRENVIREVLPYVNEILDYGCNSFIDCTPNYIGRDPLLLKRISEISGMNILTNTGYYGAADNKYLPSSAYDSTARQLSDIWSEEFVKGIGNSGVKPGFIKIGVAPGPLSSLHQKLIRAAALTHLQTGLSIASHTGPAIPAFEQTSILNELGISSESFIWVHAQNEHDLNKRFDAARQGMWISLDGLTPENFSTYRDWLTGFKKNGLLNKVLVSHDAGWYTPGEDKGGDFRPYTAVFKMLIPQLRLSGFTQADIDQIFVVNPGNAFSVRIRKL